MYARGEGFVEVVDSPDEAAFGVAPGAEVLDVEIADAEDGWSLGEFLASFRPVLKPAIEGGAEEGERILRHERMFERDVLADDGEALGKPLLEVRGGLKDVHGCVLLTFVLFCVEL